MADQDTLIADLAGRGTQPSPFEARPVRPADLDALGRLYFDSYDPGVACDTIEEAIADIQASFDGEYGELLEEAWAGFPDCPLIIELFVARPHRRQGIGSGLVEKVMGSLSEIGETCVTLQVDVGNRPARGLYESLGFMEWSPHDGPRSASRRASRP